MRHSHKIGARLNRTPKGKPVRPSLRGIKNEAMSCRRCGIWQCGGEVVFGEGPRHARLIMVGEQPGDVEDRLHRPFVGPAGKVLDEAIEAAGLSRQNVYLTNAVKHFKFRLRGKRRMHQRPTAGEIDICKWWLWQEIRVIRPRLVVALGATAVRAVTGKSLAIGRHRGKVLSIDDQISMMITIHPSYILRQRDSQARAKFQQILVNDLVTARIFLSSATETT